MTWKDRMLFLGPSMASLGPMVIKILPSVGLLVGLVALYLVGPETTREFDFDVGKALDRLLKLTAHGGGSPGSQVDGTWAAVPLAVAKRFLEESWDNIFTYKSEPK